VNLTITIHPEWLNRPGALALKLGVLAQLQAAPPELAGTPREPGEDPVEPRHRPATPPPAPPPAAEPAPGLEPQRQPPRPGKARSQWGTAPKGPAVTTRAAAAPRTGKALFAWLKDAGQQHQLDLVGFVNQWARQQADAPDRIIDFDARTVAGAYHIAMVKIRESIASDRYQESLT
jgi:hypothetical protein